MAYTYHVSCATPVHFCSPITPEYEPPEREAPQYRKIVRGFYQSQERDEDEFAETPTEGPNISSGGIGPIAVEEYQGW